MSAPTTLKTDQSVHCLAAGAIIRAQPLEMN